jgi:hypothetical protein
MFRKLLTSQLTNIFDIKKVSFSQPSESNEQDTLFVKIASAKYRPNETKIIGRVVGKITLYSNHEKLPFGFFIKQIQKSKVDDKQLFFYNIEENNEYMAAVDLVERSCEFIYFYSEDFDPAKGEINELTFI